MMPVANQARGSSAQVSQKLQYSGKMLQAASANDLPAGSSHTAKSSGTGPRGCGHGWRTPPQGPPLWVLTSSARLRHSSQGRGFRWPSLAPLFQSATGTWLSDSAPTKGHQDPGVSLHLGMEPECRSWQLTDTRPLCLKRRRCLQREGSLPSGPATSSPTREKGGSGEPMGRQTGDT